MLTIGIKLCVEYVYHFSLNINDECNLSTCVAMSGSRPISGLDVTGSRPPVAKDIYVIVLCTAGEWLK